MKHFQKNLVPTIIAIMAFIVFFAFNRSTNVVEKTTNVIRVLPNSKPVFYAALRCEERHDPLSIYASED